MNHHMGVVNPSKLKESLLAAAVLRNSPDPKSAITEYLVLKNVFTSNIRSDTGEPNTWRDYQQILSQLGLIYSTEVLAKITPTPLGMAFLDELLTFDEVITMQALRCQYPNGHNTVISKDLRKTLVGTTLETTRNLPDLQQNCGVQLRPGVLVWQVIRTLANSGELAEVTIDEIQSYLMRCATHADTDRCVTTMVEARHGGLVYPKMTRGRRDAQEWINLLLLTPIFHGKKGRGAKVSISDAGMDNVEAIDSICSDLSAPSSFWNLGSLSRMDRQVWYDFIGSVSLDTPAISLDATLPTQYTSAIEDKNESPNARQIILRDFSANNLVSLSDEQDDNDNTITSTYDAGLANSKHQLHDLMVIHIAKTCKSKGALIYDDPNTVDLLIDFDDAEYIVEVKSVTPRNFAIRLRYALGQVLHYDYLRSLQTQKQRRKVIAFAAQVSSSSWSIPFLNNHLDVDILSIDGQKIRVDSLSAKSRQLFDSAIDGTLAM